MVFTRLPRLIGSKIKSLSFEPIASTRALGGASWTRVTSDEEFEPIRQVFISQSTDVFTNLALEDWLYRNHDFEHKVGW